MKRVRRDIIVASDESNLDAIARCAPKSAKSAKIVGGFPVGSHWEGTKGIVVEYVLDRSKG